MNGQGKTATERRTLKVGGTASDLSFELNPIEPKPGQTVNVAISMVNAKPGAVIRCRVVGSDPTAPRTGSSCPPTASCGSPCRAGRRTWSTSSTRRSRGRPATGGSYRF